MKVNEVGSKNWVKASTLFRAKEVKQTDLYIFLINDVRILKRINVVIQADIAIDFKANFWGVNRENLIIKVLYNIEIVEKNCPILYINKDTKVVKNEENVLVVREILKVEENIPHLNAINFENLEN